MRRRRPPLPAQNLVPGRPCSRLCLKLLGDTVPPAQRISVTPHPSVRTWLSADVTGELCRGRSRNRRRDLRGQHGRSQHLGSHHKLPCLVTEEPSFSTWLDGRTGLQGKVADRAWNAGACGLEKTPCYSQRGQRDLSTSVQGSTPSLRQSEGPSRSRTGLQGCSMALVSCY